MEQQDAPATPQPDVPLAVEVQQTIMEAIPVGGGDMTAMSATSNHQDFCAKAAAAVMQLLLERGHYLPGAPPAQQILEDAKSFAERLTMALLTVRIVAMLYTTVLDTPESKPAKQWITDYIDGKNHGPTGCPMLWPARLPGMAALLRDWGFMPTPTMPPFVARALPNPTPQ